MSKLKAILVSIFALSVASISASTQASGNERYHSFAKVKKILHSKVYFDHYETFYCKAKYNEKKEIKLPSGFTTPAHDSRAHKLEWEHILPAENFGRNFSEWTKGDIEKCVKSSGKPFKGRKCAEKNPEFARMQADMYNLVPAIGAVNAIRQNYNYALIPGATNTFGSCSMKIVGNKAEPPEYTRGFIARTYLYMDDAYPLVKLSSQTVKLMQAWNKMYKVDAWECLRAKRIEKLQGNENKFVKNACKKENLW